VTDCLRIPDPRERPWLTVSELAAITGEGEKAIRAALDAGVLPELPIGRYRRIPTAALLRLLQIEPEHTNGDSATEPPIAVVRALTKSTGDNQDGTHPAA